MLEKQRKRREKTLNLRSSISLPVCREPVSGTEIPQTKLRPNWSLYANN